MSRRKMQPLLWKTTSRLVPCYFLGTMHLADTWYNITPQNLLRTFDACDVVCVEFDILKASKSQHKTATTALKRAVSKDTVDTVVRKAKAAKLRIDKASKSTPKNLQLCGIEGYLLERAAAAKKRIISLETFKEQLESMNPPDTTDVFDRSDTENPIDVISSAFMKADAEFFSTMSSNIWGPQAANWCDRHVRMTQRLLSHLNAMPEESFFVAIGALHLLSPANVLQMLALGGVTVEKV